MRVNLGNAHGYGLRVSGKKGALDDLVGYQTNKVVR
jgi:hypothetical protein